MADTPSTPCNQSALQTRRENTMLVRIAHWVFVVFLGLIGLYLTVAGGGLIYLGGSWYYVLAGLAMLAVTVSLVRRHALAPPAVRRHLGHDGALVVT